jgi:hypothetical protein
VGVPLHGFSCRIKPHDGCFKEIRDPEEGPKGVLEIRDPKAGPKGVSNFCKALVHGFAWCKNWTPLYSFFCRVIPSVYLQDTHLVSWDFFLKNGCGALQKLQKQKACLHFRFL